MADSNYQKLSSDKIADFRAMIEASIPSWRAAFSKADLLTRKQMHVKMVQRIAGYFIDLIREQTAHHDEDKLIAYKQGEMVDSHVHHVTQRHHIFNNDAIKLDVNIVDLVECLCDNIAAAILEGHDGVDLLNIKSTKNKAVTFNRILLNSADLCRDVKWNLTNDVKAWD